MITQQNKSKASFDSKKGRSLNECFSFLEKIKDVKYEEGSKERVKLLDQACNSPSKELEMVLVSGSDGKSSTILFSSKLFQEEGFKVGTFFSSHILSFSERFFINNQSISSKELNEALDFVIDSALKNNIEATSFEICLVTSMILFKQNSVDIALFEAGIGGKFDATAALSPLITAITKVKEKNIDILGEDLDQACQDLMESIPEDCWIISAEQSKNRLQKMKAFAEKKNLKWSMPIRKLAPLPYIYEQLYGKYASLAERIVQIFVEEIKGNFSPFLRGNLLATEKGKRGRPTLEAKKEADKNPLKTIQSFWQNEFELKRGKFEILEKEKPTVIIDDSSSQDGIESLFLGIRLLNYKRAIEGSSIILGLNHDVKISEIVKAVRYLFKKVSGEVFFVPLEKQPHHNPEELAKIARDSGIRAHFYKDLKTAFQDAKQTVDSRNGIVCISGSKELVTKYWKEVREIKKL